MDVDKVEKKVLWVTVVANSIMAVAGWITFYFTGSQAILLDGNFSIVLAFATMIAIYISKIKHQKTTTFPYGSYVYEAAFVLSKGLLIVGILVAAFIQNTLKIIDYFMGVEVVELNLQPIYYYTVFILVLSLILILYFNYQNKKINNKSSLLLIESEAIKIDGGLTLATGITFFLLSFIGYGSSIEFLKYIGDSIIVLVLGILMIGSPLKIIKNAFIELGGGTIQNSQDKQKIELGIGQVIKDQFNYDSFITKVGSGYLIVIYVKGDGNSLSIDEFKEIKNHIEDQLITDFSSLIVEISLKN